MSDPAVEAVERACVYTATMGDLPIAAVREALKPLRELHRPGPLLRLSTAWLEGAKQECRHCRRAWPCQSARLAYPESELS